MLPVILSDIPQYDKLLILAKTSFFSMLFKELISVLSILQEELYQLVYTY